MWWMSQRLREVEISSNMIWYHFELDIELQWILTKSQYWRTRLLVQAFASLCWLLWLQWSLRCRKWSLTFVIIKQIIFTINLYINFLLSLLSTNNLWKSLIINYKFIVKHNTLFFSRKYVILILLLLLI